MIIERINDNQIRCILNEEDLREHKVKLSELAFGSKRTKELFRHMMEQAFDEVGFEAENAPLMIEAMPMNKDSIVLVVTKVENTEDIKERFAHLPTLDLREEATSFDDMEDENDILDLFDDEIELEDEDGVIDINIDIDMQSPEGDEGKDFTEEQKKAMLESAMDLIAPFTKALEKAKQEALKRAKGEQVSDEDRLEDLMEGNGEKKATEEKTPKRVLKPVQYYIFDSLEGITDYSQLIAPFYEGESIVYKELSSNLYYLALLRYNSSEDSFLRACHLASDYATSMKPMYTTQAYMEEHFKVILKEQAIETLASL